MSNVNQELDVRGLSCPLPILRTKKAVAGMSAGETLRVLATDPGSLKDMESFCRHTGNELMESTQDGGDFVFILRKG